MLQTDAVLDGAVAIQPETIGRQPFFGGRNENLADVAHDARNMVTTLTCYCDLLDEPGVLTAPYQHYGSELRLVVAASRRLVEKLLALENPDNSGPKATNDEPPNRKGLALSEPARKGAPAAKHFDTLPPKLINDFAWELNANRNLLAALAGPSIKLTVDAPGGALPVRMTCEDLTRILVNLVKNAVEAMPTGGIVRLSLRESPAGPGEDVSLILNIEDNGPGIPLESMEKIFVPGYTTRSRATDGYGVWRPEHHGLGLSITRSIVEAAGGKICAANRDPVGACFQIELPVRASKASGRES
jgi:signal transduction histidine kinase